MKSIKISIFVLLFISTALLASDGKKYGKKITLKEKTAISKIVENPELFEGKKVLVEGTVVGVCKKRGCWIEIAGDKEGESMRVKVDDGVIVFPIESKGKKALVEGEVYSVVVPAEKNEEKHIEGKDKDKCENEKEGGKIYMIKGLGAVIK